MWSTGVCSIYVVFVIKYVLYSTSFILCKKNLMLKLVLYILNYNFLNILIYYTNIAECM